MKIYHEGNYHELIHPPATADGGPQVLPRRTLYGSHEAGEHGLIPLGEYPDKLIDLADLKEIIAYCHANKIFPLYHQEAAGWAPGYNQNGYGYCWTYGLTGCAMDCREGENQDHVRLSPFSLGWLVDWKNAGYYLDGTIKGARDRGIATIEYVPEYNLRPNTFKPGWEQDALKYRVLEWWDTQGTSAQTMLQHCATILSMGRPCFVAYNFWGHALELVALNWDQRYPNNVVWVLRNSHGELEVIGLTGSRGVPDEAYGPRSTSLAI